MAQSVADGSVARTVEEEEDDFGPLLIKKLEVCTQLVESTVTIWKLAAEMFLLFRNCRSMASRAVILKNWRRLGIIRSNRWRLRRRNIYCKF